MRMVVENRYGGWEYSAEPFPAFRCGEQVVPIVGSFNLVTTYLVKGGNGTIYYEGGCWDKAQQLALLGKGRIMTVEGPVLEEDSFDLELREIRRRSFIQRRRKRESIPVLCPLKHERPEYTSDHRVLLLTCLSPGCHRAPELSTSGTANVFLKHSTGRRGLYSGGSLIVGAVLDWGHDLIYRVDGHYDGKCYPTERITYSVDSCGELVRDEEEE